MATTLIGKKIRMTQIYDEAGNVQPVTVVQAGPCQVVQIKTVENDAYAAVQIGFDDAKAKRVTQPEQGHYKKWNATPKRVLREVPVEPSDELSPGDQIDVGIFDGVNYVDVEATSKGRGFAGMVKRWHKRLGPHSHGSKSHRTPGSAGMHTYPGRILKGKHYPGQMGNVQTTIRNVALVKIEKDHNLLYLRGSVPGPTNGYVVVRRSTSKN